MSDDDKNAVDERLSKLGKAVAAFKSKLELHGLFHEGHKITEKELTNRLREVEAQVQNRTLSGEHAKKKAGFLEHELEKWVSSTDIDFKP
jgi:hypothetical protein